MAGELKMAAGSLFWLAWRAASRLYTAIQELSAALRALRLSVRTPGFQPGKRGSIPLGPAIA